MLWLKTQRHQRHLRAGLTLLRPLGQQPAPLPPAGFAPATTRSRTASRNRGPGSPDNPVPHLTHQPQLRFPDTLSPVPLPPTAAPFPVARVPSLPTAAPVPGRFESRALPTDHARFPDVPGPLPYHRPPGSGSRTAGSLIPTHAAPVPGRACGSPAHPPPRLRFPVAPVPLRFRTQDLTVLSQDNRGWLRFPDAPVPLIPTHRSSGSRSPRSRSGSAHRTSPSSVGQPGLAPVPRRPGPAPVPHAGPHHPQ